MPMRMKFSPELWTHCVESGGFIGGYSRVGLGILLRAVNTDSLIESNRRRLASITRYTKRYYHLHIDRMRAYRREYYHLHIDRMRAYRRRSMRKSKCRKVDSANE